MDDTNQPTTEPTIERSTELGERLTLVLGGTGKTGRRVADRLRRHGVPTRIGSRGGSPPFSWEDDATWDPVLRGVTAAYVVYYPDLAFPGASDVIAAFADRATAAGVERLVLLSGRGEPRALVSERALQDRAAEWTIVRASWFAQNFSEHFLLEPVRSGVIALPAADIEEPFVDADDIADIVCAALTTDRHVGEVYEVTGPRLLTFADAAGEIAKATGRPVEYLPVTAEEYEVAALAAGVPIEEVAPLTDLFALVLDGRNASVTDGVQRALGRPARDFADYARDAAATGVWA